VIFPSLARAHAASDIPKFNQLAGRAIKMTFLMLAPMTVFLFVFRAAIAELLFHRGSMQPAALEEITFYFGILLLQVVPGNFITFLQKLSFSLNDTKSAAIFSGMNVALLAVLLTPASSQFGAPGVVYAYSLVQALIPILFFIYLIARFRFMSLGSLSKSVSMVALLSFAIAMTLLFIRTRFPGASTAGRLTIIAELAVGSLSFLIVGVVCARILRIGEVRELEEQARIWIRRLSPRPEARS
jgi:peptidoglycan biosynthesis protein MviN/MurJ (putative lipid II flippase)